MSASSVRIGRIDVAIVRGDRRNFIVRRVVCRQLFDAFAFAVDKEDFSPDVNGKEEPPVVAKPNRVPPEIGEALIGFGFEGIDENPCIPSAANDSSPTGDTRSIARPGPGDELGILFRQRRQRWCRWSSGLHREDRGVITLVVNKKSSVGRPHGIKVGFLSTRNLLEATSITVDGPNVPCIGPTGYRMLAFVHQETNGDGDL